MKNDPESSLQAALDAAEKGYLPVAMLPGQKIPAESWKRWLEEEVTLESIYARWEGTRNGLAIICDGIVVVDVDDENELDFAIENAGKTPCICRTPRGFHLVYRRRNGLDLGKKGKVKGRELDLLTGTALSNIPPSENEAGVRYEWLAGGLIPKAELPIARISWSRERTRKKAAIVTAIPDTPDFHELLRRGQLYVDRFEQAKSGEGGHRMTFIAALKICRFAKGDRDLAWALLQYFSRTKCDPEWPEKALLHKLDESMKKFRFA